MCHGYVGGVYRDQGLRLSEVGYFGLSTQWEARYQYLRNDYTMPPEKPSAAPALQPLPSSPSSTSSGAQGLLAEPSCTGHGDPAEAYHRGSIYRSKDRGEIGGGVECRQRHRSV